MAKRIPGVEIFPSNVRQSIPTRLIKYGLQLAPKKTEFLFGVKVTPSLEVEHLILPLHLFRRQR